MSMFANGALQMRVRKHQNETSDHHAEVDGRTDFTFTKTDIQFMRRECNRILKELEENK